MASTISAFWAAHPECWFPITAKQKEAADKLIHDNFYDYDYESENLPGRCIYRDQFMRHFQRLGLVTEAEVAAARAEAADDVERNADELICYRESDLVACLMPFKHLGRFTYIFDYLHNTYLPDMGWSDVPDAECIMTYPVLARFYYDTYRKWQSDATIAANLIVTSGERAYIYEAAAVCESDAFPESLDLSEVPKPLVDALAGADPGTLVSLSGGIDSMVALTILQALGKAPRAVHIIYGNRHTSHDEFCFVAEFCRRLGVPLTAYEIPHIRRGAVDRDFYESATRAIRFGVYRVIANGSKVLLGHIQDDIVENIWTNFARGINLDNLAKMDEHEEQLGVHLWRPMLHIPKSQIYEVAAKMHIPHLKNTTPSWANRGKFREHFYAATHAQYGPGVDRSLLEVAETLRTQAALIDRLVYRQIYESWDAATATADVGPALKAELDAAGWLRIFRHICHKCLQVRCPSIHAMREFVRRLGAEPLRMNVGKNVSITLTGDSLRFVVGE